MTMLRHIVVVVTTLIVALLTPTMFAAAEKGDVTSAVADFSTAGVGITGTVIMRQVEGEKATLSVDLHGLASRAVLWFVYERPLSDTVAAGYGDACAPSRIGSPLKDTHEAGNAKELETESTGSRRLLDSDEFRMGDLSHKFQTLKDVDDITEVWKDTMPMPMVVSHLQNRTLALHYANRTVLACATLRAVTLQDCVLSDKFGEWEPCTANCTQTRSRDVLVLGAAPGRMCPARDSLDFSETRDCVSESCFRSQYKLVKDPKILDPTLEWSSGTIAVVVILSLLGTAFLGYVLHLVYYACASEQYENEHHIHQLRMAERANAGASSSYAPPMMDGEGGDRVGSVIGTFNRGGKPAGGVTDKGTRGGRAQTEDQFKAFGEDIFHNPAFHVGTLSAEAAAPGFIVDDDDVPDDIDIDEDGKRESTMLPYSGK